MPTNPKSWDQALSATGSLRIECGDFQFDLRLTPNYFVADFPSFGMLLRANGKKKELKKLIKDIPVPTSFHSASKKLQASGIEIPFIAENCIYAAAKGRPVGKITLKHGKLAFTPTPIRFFSGLK